MVSSTPSDSNLSDFTTASHDEFNVTFLNVTLPVQDDGESNSKILLDYGILPLFTIITFLILVGVAAFLIRKRRLDKLRHHLMPLYSFDPAEEGEDWEAELLEEGTDHQPKGKGAKPSEQPQLSFRSNL